MKMAIFKTMDSNSFKWISKIVVQRTGNRDSTKTTDAFNTLANMVTTLVDEMPTFQRNVY